MKNILQDLIALVGLCSQDYFTLQAAFPETKLWGEEIIKDFYDTLFSYEPTQLVFNPDERTERESTLREWYLEVIQGQLDDNFWRRQWVVGMVHIPRKVKNPYVLGIMSHLQQLFLKKCFQTFPPERALAVYTSFKRVTDIVAGLIAEGYLMVSVYGLSAGKELGFPVTEHKQPVIINPHHPIPPVVEASSAITKETMPSIDAIKPFSDLLFTTLKELNQIAARQMENILDIGTAAAQTAHTLVTTPQDQELNTALQKLKTSLEHYKIELVNAQIALTEMLVKQSAPSITATNETASSSIGIDQFEANILSNINLAIQNNIAFQHQLQTIAITVVAKGINLIYNTSPEANT
jgi:hypothetical protein